MILGSVEDVHVYDVAEESALAAELEPILRFVNECQNEMQQLREMTAKQNQVIQMLKARQTGNFCHQVCVLLLVFLIEQMFEKAEW